MGTVLQCRLEFLFSFGILRERFRIYAKILDWN